jgi:nucleoside-diphosphate kinase
MAALSGQRTSGLAVGGVQASGLGLVGWSRWSVIYLKPDAVQRQLEREILSWIGEFVTVLAVTPITVTKEQIFAHYADMFSRATEIGVDIGAELTRMHVGRRAVVALGYGDQATIRLRDLIGPTDPAMAGPGTIRGRYGIDSLAAGRSEHRLIDNLIHTSDDPAAARRDFLIWFGAEQAALLCGPPTTGGHDDTPC